MHLITAPNGLRLVADPVKSVDTVSIGVWAGVGTRHEDLAENGIAHLVEHMMFKGTRAEDGKGRSALDIARMIEDVGGRMNAYTSRDITCYFIHVLKDDMDLALDLLADMVQHPAFEEKELERERGVILSEIGLSNDTPDDVIFDYYQETAYPAQGLGAPILGREDIIRNIGREALQRYVTRHYNPANLVVSAAGNFDPDRFAEKVQSAFTDLPGAAESPSEHARYKGGVMVREKELEQAHIVLGFESLSRHDEDYYAGKALASALGGGMSSRLFHEIREQRGLCYTVFAHHSGYDDAGQFVVYAGTAGKDVPELMQVMGDELAAAPANISDEDLARAKAQMRSGLLMGRESMMRRADQNARALLYFGELEPVEHQVRRIEAVDRAALDRVAGRIFAGFPTLAALGPVQDLPDFEIISGRLSRQTAA